MCLNDQYLICIVNIVSIYPKHQLVAANILIWDIKSHGTSIEPISIKGDVVTVVVVEAWMLN